MCKMVLGDKIGNNIGFKTNKQSEDMQNTYNEHYYETEEKNEQAELKKAAVENIVEALDARKNGDTILAAKKTKVAMKNLNEFYQKFKMQYKGFGNEVEKSVIEQSETPDERHLRELGKAQKNPVKVRIIQGIIQDAKSFSPK
jgi:hypothetical protein